MFQIFRKYFYMVNVFFALLFANINVFYNHIPIFLARNIMYFAWIMLLLNVGMFFCCHVFKNNKNKNRHQKSIPTIPQGNGIDNKSFLSDNLFGYQSEKEYLKLKE